jgi:hypothetical protein
MTWSDCGLRMCKGSRGDEHTSKKTLNLETPRKVIEVNQCVILFHTPRRFKICQVITEIGYPSDIKSVNDQGQLQRIHNSVLSELHVDDRIGAVLTKGMRPRRKTLNAPDGRTGGTLTLTKHFKKSLSF